MNDFLLQAGALAHKVHAGQFRKDGVTPYITHIEDVVRRLKKRSYSDVVLAAGFLHDVLEQGGSVQELKACMPVDVFSSVRLLTRFPAYTYKDYLNALVKDPIARTVKVFDMISNLADDPTNDQLTRYASGISFIMSHGGILPAV